MLSWGTIAVSAALTAVATLFGMAPFERPLEARRLLIAAMAAAAGPLLWHALTRVATPGPLTAELTAEAFPASRSDAGVGLATLATVALALGFGPGPHHRGGLGGRRVRDRCLPDVNLNHPRPEHQRPSSS